MPSFPANIAQPRTREMLHCQQDAAVHNAGTYHSELTVYMAVLVYTPTSPWGTCGRRGCLNTPPPLGRYTDQQLQTVHTD